MTHPCPDLTFALLVILGLGAFAGLSLWAATWAVNRLSQRRTGAEGAEERQ